MTAIMPGMGYGTSYNMTSAAPSSSSPSIVGVLAHLALTVGFVVVLSGVSRAYGEEDALKGQDEDDVKGQGGEVREDLYEGVAAMFDDEEDLITLMMRTA